MTDNRPEAWVDGNQLQISITSPHGELYHQSLPLAVLVARASRIDEILRFTYDVVDPESGETTYSGAARIVVQDLPDPRAEVQPASPADATVAVEQLAAGRSVDEQGTAWDEAASGPPRRLADGPGCYPVAIAPSAAALAQIPAGQPDWGTCYKCRKPFNPEDTDTTYGLAQQYGMPFCRGCVSRCHDTEIADHWCMVDQWRTEGGKA